MQSALYSLNAAVHESMRLLEPTPSPYGTPLIDVHRMMWESRRTIRQRKAWNLRSLIDHVRRVPEQCHFPQLPGHHESIKQWLALMSGKALDDLASIPNGARIFDFRDIMFHSLAQEHSFWLAYYVYGAVQSIRAVVHLLLGMRFRTGFHPRDVLIPTEDNIRMCAQHFALFEHAYNMYAVREVNRALLFEMAYAAPRIPDVECPRPDDD